MRDPAWLDDEDLSEEPVPRRARPLLIALALLPWVVVVALFVVPGEQANQGAQTLEGADAIEGAHGVDGSVTPEPSTPEPSTPDPSTTEPPATEPPTTEAVDRGAEGTVSDAEAPGPGTSAVRSPTPAPGDADLVAVALLAARSWLSGADRHDHALAIPSPEPTQYAEHLHLEGFDGDQDLLVARVVALLLDVDAAQPPRLQRIAVPLATTPDGPRLLGEPWALPTPTLDVAALSTETLTDPVLTEAAEQALRDAGFAAPRVRRLARTAGWPLVVAFTTEQRDEEQQVWLQAARGGELRVAGQLAPPDPEHRRSGGAVDAITDAGDRP
jgi:hypothetical protein